MSAYHVEMIFLSIVIYPRCLGGEHERGVTITTAYLPSGVVISVPAGGVNSKVELGMEPRVSFE